MGLCMYFISLTYSTTETPSKIKFDDTKYAAPPSVNLPESKASDDGAPKHSS